MSADERRRVFLELVGLWLVTLLLMRAVLALQAALGESWEALLVVPALLFVYAPVLLCRWRGVDSYDYRIAIAALGDGERWGRALRVGLGTALALALPWWGVYHLYQTTLFGLQGGQGWPQNVPLLVAYQLFNVALPEEFFYRGYVQTRLNEVFPRRFLVLGVPMGWGAVWATLFFAFGHSVVHVQWWHFSTFFPGLAFAWMREKTGSVEAGAFFHAACNVGIVLLDTQYGILPP